MPTLKSIKHETFARKVSQELLKPTPGKSPKQVYSEIYKSSDTSASSSSNALLNRDDVSSRIKYLIAQATPPEFLSKQLKQLSKAKRGIYYKGRLTATEPDNGIRLETVRTILKVYGVGKDDNVQQTRNTNNNFQININQTQELTPIIDELKRLNADMASGTPTINNDV